MSDEPDIKPAVGRVSSRDVDLTTTLGESIMWINLRTKLVGLLQAQADAGDPVARDQLAFLGGGAWPGGAGPRTHQFVQLETRARTLEALCARADGLLRIEGDDVTAWIADKDIWISDYQGEKK